MPGFEGIAVALLPIFLPFMAPLPKRPAGCLMHKQSGLLIAHPNRERHIEEPSRAE